MLKHLVAQLVTEMAPTRSGLNTSKGPTPFIVFYFWLKEAGMLLKVLLKNNHCFWVSSLRASGAALTQNWAALLEFWVGISVDACTTLIPVPCLGAAVRHWCVTRRADHQPWCHTGPTPPPPLPLWPCVTQCNPQSQAQFTTQCICCQG